MRSYQRFLILADDLTGAADTAAALAGPRGSAEVVLDLDEAMRCDAAIVAVDLHTRSRPVAEATAAVAAAGRNLGGRDTLIFKKIDSTLRGHVGAELAALHAALCCATAREHECQRSAPTLCLVAPAHPALGRTLESGQLKVNGVRADTLWNTRVHSHADSLIEELRACGFECAAAGMALIRNGECEALAKTFRAAAGTGPRAIVCDAQTADDMHRIAAAALESGVECIWVGSGGLALALADVLAHGQPSAAPLEEELSAMPAAGSTVFLVGSFSSIAREQVAQLAQTGLVRHVCLPVDPLTGSLDPTAASELHAALLAGNDIVVSIDPGAAIRPELSSVIAQATANLITRKMSGIGRLMICGGDTAHAVLEQLRVTRLRVRRSPELGATSAIAHMGPPTPLMLKAGAFGDPQLLVRVRETFFSWQTAPASSYTSPLPSKEHK